MFHHNIFIFRFSLCFIAVAHVKHLSLFTWVAQLPKWFALMSRAPLYFCSTNIRVSRTVRHTKIFEFIQFITKSAQIAFKWSFHQQRTNVLISWAQSCSIQRSSDQSWYVLVAAGSYCFSLLQSWEKNFTWRIHSCGISSRPSQTLRWNIDPMVLDA